MRAPDSNDDFERRRRTARLLSRIHVLSLAVLVLSIVPGMPGLILAGSVAFQDQLGSFDRGLALGCLATLCVAGLVGSVVASKRLRKLGATQLTDARRSIAHAASDEQEPAAKEPKVNATRIVGAGLASTVFGIHSAVAMGALVISTAAVPAAFAGSTLYPTLDFFPRLIWSCVFAIPLAATSIAIWRRFRPGAPAWFHLVVGGLAALGVPIVAYALVVWCNGALDSSDPRSHEATLVQKHTRSEGRGAPSMWFELSSWREPRKSERIRVNAGMFESWNRGDAVIVTTRKGALRMEYWTWIAPRPDFEPR